MDNKFLCVLAGYDDEKEKYIARLQDNLYKKGFVGTQTKDIPMHITMGTFDTRQEKHLIEKLEEVAAKTSPFDVNLSHIGIFSGGKVLFVTPDINRELLALKEQFGDSANWTAHTTLLIDQPEVIQSALADVVENFVQTKAKIDRLHLFEFWPTRHITTVKFKG